MKALIVHGSFSSPEQNWFPWLKSELEKQSIECILPQFPVGDNQSFHSWYQVLIDTDFEFNNETILIGHSIGVAFILRLLEGLSAPVGASILVSGFLHNIGIEEYDSVNSSFINHEFEWEKINLYKGNAFISHGDDDPYVPIQMGKEIADVLHIELDVIKEGGHLNSESGYDTFPLVLREIQTCISK